MMHWRGGIDAIKPARFGMDDSPAFPGWHDPTIRWNGWACPYFTKATTLEILAYISDPHSDLRWHWDGDVLVEETLGAETERYEPMTIPGVEEPVYSLGAFAWVWSVA